MGIDSRNGRDKPAGNTFQQDTQSQVLRPTKPFTPQTGSVGTSAPALAGGLKDLAITRVATSNSLAPNRAA